MGKKDSYIKLDKDFLNWRWFRNRNTFIVYMYLLASANLTTETLFGETVERGSILIRNSNIASDCGLTVQNVRTALANLVKSNDITREYRNHYQIITITNFDSRVID